MRELRVVNSPKRAIVDAEDYERLCKYKWYFNGGFSVRRMLHRGRKTSAIPLANEVLKWYGIIVDHINRNGFDNRKSNLRLCNQSQNVANREKCRINSTSGYKGVSWSKVNKKWVVHIQINGKVLHLGYFLKEEDAAKAYNRKALELFSEFACLNKDKKGNIL